MLGTGFDVRADRHPLLDPAACAPGCAPATARRCSGRGFESSVPGLHFVGAFSAASFGPVMRFVSGTPFTGRALAAHVGSRAPRRRPATQPASAAA